MNFLKKVCSNKKVVFTILLIISGLCSFYRLTEASLRFDEAMEYMISISDWDVMYGLICRTFQPPLYNAIMHVWLSLSDSILLFKLSTVIFYTIGTLGLIKCVYYIKKTVASVVIAIVVQFSFSAMIYYSQICGEYIMVFPILYWLLYITVKMIREKKFSQIVLWIILAVLAMGMQYGAMFTIFGAGIVSLGYFLFKKEYKALKQLLITGVSAIILFMVPLYMFFARVQMESQRNAGQISSEWSAKTIIQGWLDAIQFMLFSWHNNYKESILKLFGLSCIIFVCLVIITAIVKYKQKAEMNKEVLGGEVGIIILIGVISYFAYGLGVAAGIYAYGNYTSRHTALMIPVVVASLSCFISSIYKLVIIQIKKMKINLTAIIIMMNLGMFSVNTIHYVWYENWDYDQLDTAIEIVNLVDKDIPVWVSLMAVPTVIVYDNQPLEIRKEQYLRYMNDEDLKVQSENYIYSKSDDIMEDFDNKLPEECVVVITDFPETMENVQKAFLEQGYEEMILQEAKESAMSPGTCVIKYTK